MAQKRKASPAKKKNAKLKKTDKKTPLWKKALLFSTKAFAFLVGFLFLFLLFVYLGIFGPIPSEKDLVGIDNNIASEIYAIDGSLMGKYYYQNRMSVENKHISKHASNALIATEDSRFFEHKGFDIVSLGRVLFRTVLMGDTRQGGGSTISQQLAKNLFPRQSYGAFSMLVNKSREIFTAARLEKVYSKDQILIMYLNTVPFGEDVYGIEAASQRFFNKRSANLKPNEAAVLVGMLAANTAYNPRLHPEKSKNRRNIVLSRMESQNFISSAEAEKYKASGLGLHYRKMDHNTGVAPYFRDVIKRKAQKILKDQYGDHYNIYTDGLKIYTTIDPTLQKYAEEAVLQHMHSLQLEFKQHWKNRDPWKNDPNVFNRELKRTSRYKALKAKGKSEEEIRSIMSKLERMTIFAYPEPKEVNLSPMDSIRHYLKILNTGFMVMDPQKGHVLSWVGGVNHEYFQYDHVTARRQVGSTFKPIVYATALQNGMLPCDYISNEQRVYSQYKDWSPANSDGEHEGYYSMKGGLSNSVNTITAEIMVETGVDKVIDLAQQMGVKSNLPAVPSISLGTGEITLQEMLTVYSCFANEGRKSEAVALLKIEDGKGNVLYEYKAPAKNENILSPETAELMNHMLQGVVENGTGRALHSQYGLKSKIAGKTGTTQNNADGWFIGYTPNLLAGAWVGAESPKVHFRTTALGQGAHMALPIYGLFMKKVEANSKYNKYTRNNFKALSASQRKLVDCADFSETDPDKQLFDLFRSNDKKEARKQKQRDERKQKDTPTESDEDIDEKRNGLLNKMKGLFRKKE
ncbi:transglycosylase domain-containing protein [Saccharicrinis aurantiacus]|uniref:transglycosylase domain-containing protein n=1 Tax=Saccharicrinis aurantiacus TaxID=1849719 RepID=UPI002491EB7C|nr:transglycosylase domain-containing protein [Saccharicrinis aurantiacus]